MSYSWQGNQSAQVEGRDLFIAFLVLMLWVVFIHCLFWTQSASNFAYGINQNPATASIACEKLLRPKDLGEDPSLNASPSQDSANPLREHERNAREEPAGEDGSRKRKREVSPAPTKSSMQVRYAVCSQCDKDYDVGYNSATACIYHSGLLEGTEEVFVDVYENDHIDYESLFADSPEMFEWNCCRRQGNETGCKEGPHRPKKAGEEVKRWFADF